MKKIFTFFLIITLFFTISCSKENSIPQSPNIIGHIQEISEDGQSILIDSTSADVPGPIWISISNETVFDTISESFSVGNYVEVLVTDGIAESYPMQGIANTIYVNQNSNKKSAD